MTRPLGSAAAWLVLPVALLLFGQWPLREWVHAWSREANDLAQWLFALYVAVALTAATRAGAHPAVGAPSRAARWLFPVCVLPWAGFILVTGTASTWRSLCVLELFPDSYNPGYFLVKLGAWLMAALVAGQAIRDLIRR